MPQTTMPRIVNRSDWPDAFLKVLLRWCIRREPKLRRWTIQEVTFRACGRRGHYRGTAYVGRGRITITFPRRWAGSLERKDSRFAWARPEHYRCRLEVFVGLIAHEIHHFTGGRPADFRSASGRYDRAGMEYRCNLAGQKAADEFHAAWPSDLRERVAKALRRAKQPRRPSLSRKEQAAKRRAAADARVRAKLAAWERKLKLAQTKVKKYRLQSRARERAAAMRQQKEQE